MENYDRSKLPIDEQIKDLEFAIKANQQMARTWEEIGMIDVANRHRLVASELMQEYLNLKSKCSTQ